MKIEFNTIRLLENILNDVAKKIGVPADIFNPDVRV